MSDVYKVVAPLVLVKDEAGRINYAYENALVRLSAEQAEQFLDERLVVESDVEIGGGDTDGRPPRNAKKDDLVAWLAANVSKDDGTDYTTEELEALNKDQLWALIDSVE